MSSSEIQTIAEEVRQSFQYQAFFCEQLDADKVAIKGVPIDLQDSAYRSSRVQSRVISCAALAGLSFIWETLDKPKYQFGGGDTERFIGFLLSLKSNKDFGRVATPFLHRTLERQRIERYFRYAVYLKWVKQENPYQAHPVYNDPYADEVEKLYAETQKRFPPLPVVKQLANLDHALFIATYAGLIYKLYRNPFAHEFHPSSHTDAMGKPGEPIRVLRFSGVQVPSDTSSGEVVYTTRKYIDEKSLMPVTLPFLDAPITILTDAIREGAKMAYNLIIRERYIPYGYDEGLRFNTRKP